MESDEYKLVVSTIVLAIAEKPEGCESEEGIVFFLRKTTTNVVKKENVMLENK